MGSMNKSDEVIVLRYLENTMVTPSTEDVEAILRKHPDYVYDVLSGLEAKEMIWSEESDWRMGVSWGLTTLGAAVCLLLKESGARNLELLEDEINLVRKGISGSTDTVPDGEGRAALAGDKEVPEN